MTNLSPEEKLRKARIKLQRSQPFFSYLAMKLKLVEKDNLPMPTMGVDYKGNLYFDPEFVEEHSLEELKGCVCHEVLHLGLGHNIRQGSRDNTAWNIAADYAINLKVDKAELELPEGAAKDDKYEDMSAEEIYDDLPKQKLKIKGGGGDGDEDGDNEGKGKTIEIDGKEVGKRFDDHSKLNGSGGESGEDQDEDEQKSGAGKQKGQAEEDDDSDQKGIGEDDDSDQKGIGEDDIKKAMEKWKEAMTEAEEFARKKGKMPAGMDRTIEELLTQKLNWKHLLRRYLQRHIPSDYTYSKPSKKYHTTGYYTPKPKKENLEVILAVDTSGSISDRELAQFMTEINAINNSFRSVNMTVVVGDAELQEHYELKNGNRNRYKDIELSGGGGTDHRWIYEWIKNNKRNARVLINLTDGWTDFPDSKPRVNTIWVSTDAEEDHYPFGRVVKLEGMRDH